jgi:S1-C subfamily serine protease
VSAAACASPPAPSAIGITVKRVDAGVQPGDLLLRYNGAWVLDARQAHALMRDSAPGSTVEVELLREGKVERIFVPVQ